MLTSLSPLAAYQQKVASGDLQPDVFQQSVARRLDALYQALEAYQPRTRFDLKSLLSFGKKHNQAPRGLYIWGDVGRGKSMLMQVFFDALTLPQKRRVHFHAFMLEVHAALHRLRTQADNGKARTQDPLKVVARAVAQKTFVLCFDEFHVTNITDAMILKNLFTALWEAGVVVVATSNWAPHLLYQDGLQREAFLPFIALLKERLEVVELGSAQDYRLIQEKAAEGGACLLHPDTPENAERLQHIFSKQTNSALPQPAILEVNGRPVPVPKAAGDAAWFSFAQLCEQPLAAADYLALVAAYKVVFVAGIPLLTADNQNAAKRFMLLVDILYEAHTPLYGTIATAPQNVYRSGHLSFEFQRTVSRLVEMQGWGRVV